MNSERVLVDDGLSINKESVNDGGYNNLSDTIDDYCML